MMAARVISPLEGEMPGRAEGGNMEDIVGKYERDHSISLSRKNGLFLSGLAGSGGSG